MERNSWIFVYLALLAVHFGYALYLIRSGKDLLHEGPVTKPSAILSMLVALNGISMTAAFFPATAIAHLILHGLLSLHEVTKLGKAPHRAVFLINHLLWCALLAYPPT